MVHIKRGRRTPRREVEPRGLRETALGESSVVLSRNVRARDGLEVLIQIALYLFYFRLAGGGREGTTIGSWKL